jgi:16S rRNA (guanine(966)-N(2))-methyltransferase RsmD
MDRMRESLFAVLGDMSGCSFLDLYCGSGSVGIEAASRGADPVVFVEKDRGKRVVLGRNLGFVTQHTEVHLLPVEHYLRRVKRRFDLIFLDPPFRQPGKLEVLELIATRRVLNPGGALIVHVSKEEEHRFPLDVGSLQRYDSRLYGGSLLLFYRSGIPGPPMQGPSRRRRYGSGEGSAGECCL